jgi:hypothetical protein
MVANTKEQNLSKTPVPAQLIGEFKSYVTAETVKNYIKDVLGKDWRGEEGSSNKAAEGRTSCSIKEYRMEGYSHLGFSGDLRFIFLDDRLISTDFHPDNFLQYKEILVKKESLKLIKGKHSSKDYSYQEARVPPYTYVSFSDLQNILKHGGKAVISWEDERLSEELDRCLYKD